MGNCNKKESSSKGWVGDDGGSPTSSESSVPDNGKLGSNMFYVSKGETEEELKGGVVTSSFSSSNSTVTEVKIKITKKQLEEVLGKINAQRLSAQDVLAQLIIVSNGYQTQQRPWRPALQSITED